jgi:hypothetical protein
VKEPTSTRCDWPCHPHSFAVVIFVEPHIMLTELVATSTAASVWLHGVLALSTETEGDEGSDNGDGGTTSNASIGEINLEFCQHTLNRTMCCGWRITR